jgi:SAM-dependent methyltransferase
MSESFGETYADAYDALYAEKDYESECDVIEAMARRFGVGCEKVLDLGSGTGRHAAILGRRGHRVAGVDLSERMVAIARERVEAMSVSGVTFEVGDIRNARVEGGPFDIALLMFAVLGYQSTDDDVLRTLLNARAHLRDGGVLVFDVWNGPAVESIGPTARSRTVERDGVTIVRRAEGTLERARTICVVDYEVEHVRGGVVVAAASERHTMRYFFEPELRSLAERARLKIVATGAFPSLEGPADVNEWNAGYVAVAT